MKRARLDLPAPPPRGCVEAVGLLLQEHCALSSTVLRFEHFLVSVHHGLTLTHPSPTNSGSGSGGGGGGGGVRAALPTPAGKSVAKGPSPPSSGPPGQQRSWDEIRPGILAALESQCKTISASEHTRAEGLAKKLAADIREKLAAASKTQKQQVSTGAGGGALRRRPQRAPPPATPAAPPRGNAQPP